MFPREKTKQNCIVFLHYTIRDTAKVTKDENNNKEKYKIFIFLIYINKYNNFLHRNAKATNISQSASWHSFKEHDLYKHEVSMNISCTVT